MGECVGLSELCLHFHKSFWTLKAVVQSKYFLLWLLSHWRCGCCATGVVVVEPLALLGRNRCCWRVDCNVIFVTSHRVNWCACLFSTMDESCSNLQRNHMMMTVTSMNPMKSLKMTAFATQCLSSVLSVVERLLQFTPVRTKWVFKYVPKHFPVGAY